MLLVLVELWITLAVTWMYFSSVGRIDDATAPARRPALLVLGSLVYEDGSPGDYVRGRLDTALELYRSGEWTGSSTRATVPRRRETNPR